jgi:hypothetical protein
MATRRPTPRGRRVPILGAGEMITAMIDSIFSACDSGLANLLNESNN